MALYTLNELHSMIADQIRVLTQEGFRISHDRQVDTYSENAFNATLVKDELIVEFYAYEKNDTFIKYYLTRSGKSRLHGIINSDRFQYYKVHDDIYADTKLEADNERVKWYASLLGVDQNYKPIQTFANKI